MDLRPRRALAGASLLVAALVACTPAPRRALPPPPPPVPAALPSPTLEPVVAAAPVVPAVVTGGAVVVTHGSTARRTVFLTFDAGADTGFASQILDTLRGAGVSATFGVTGKWAEQNPALVQRMVAEGHSIVNHTYDHRSFTGTSPHTAALPAAARLAEIDHADQVLTAIAGHGIKPWFRLPYGDGDKSVNAQVLQAGYRYILGWTVDSLGWQGLSAAAISTRCLTHVAPGAILLFHVGSRSQDSVALPGIIQALKAQGYGFDTVAALGP